MNLARFFEHWKITENPFRGEEARQDPVFMRLGEMAEAGGGAIAEVLVPVREASVAAPVDGVLGASPRPGPDGATGRSRLGRTVHSDFEKIAGDFERPSTAIVFGEKGSGKTAIRIQLEHAIDEHNRARPRDRCLVVAYDELNPFLDRFFERMGGEKRAEKTGKGTAASGGAGASGGGGGGGAAVLEILRKLRLVDHLDALLSIITTRVVNELFRERALGETIELGPEPRRSARRLDSTSRHDLLLLEALYDRSQLAESRTRRLRRLLRLGMPLSTWLWDIPARFGWIVPAGFFAWAMFFTPKGSVFGGDTQITGTAAGLGAAYLLLLLKYLIWDRLGLLRLGHRVRRQLRISARGDRSFAHALREVGPVFRNPAVLPVTASDEARYAMFDRLRRFLRNFGYVSIVIIIDRVDEPTLISGDPERMQAVVWPMLNNKFLQQPGIGAKLLLPIELRHLLFRESAAFFQEARLDKQNLIERLVWTGAMLHDLCDARLQACRPPGGEPISLLSLFAEDVTVQDLVDALDQMHQPRDAFKMLYQCLTEHCSNVTEAQAQWRIPRLVLETVRKDQAERVRQLYRGVRPA